jgi:glycine cleavage system H protein
MSYNTPNTLKYTKEHEWVSIENDIALVGITDFAQSQLGDIVFIELPEVGSDVKQGGSFGVVESIKSVSDLYSPLDGEVTEVNNQLEDEPELCNNSPYDSWIIKIKLSNSSQIDELLDSSSYENLCQ